MFPFVAALFKQTEKTSPPGVLLLLTSSKGACNLDLKSPVVIFYCAVGRRTSRPVVAFCLAPEGKKRIHTEDMFSTNQAPTMMS